MTINNDTLNGRSLLSKDGSLSLAGSSAGIGRQAAIDFAKEGASVTIHGQSSDRLKVSLKALQIRKTLSYSGSPKGHSGRRRAGEPRSRRSRPHRRREGSEGTGGQDCREVRTHRRFGKSIIDGIQCTTYSSFPKCFRKYRGSGQCFS